MPIQHWTPDTTSQSSWLGTQALAGGISGGMKTLADSLGAAMEKRKNENAQAKASEALFKSTPELQDALQIDEEHFKGLSSREKNELVRGGIGKLSLMESLARGQQERQMAESVLNQRAQQEARFRAGGLALGRLGEMGQEPDSVPGPFSNEEFDRRTRQPGMMDVFRELGAAGAATGAGVDLRNVDDFSRALANAQPKATMLGPEVFKQFGMVPQGGQMNPNGSASLNFGMPTPPTPTSIKPLSVEGGGPSGKGLFGDKIVDIQAPNAEGKTLTQSENQMLGALNQAGTDLDNLEKIFKKLGPDWGGPVSGRAKNAISMGQSPDITAVENAINAATPNLARGVFREVGVLTDEDIKRYKALLPTAYDTDSVRKVKMDQLRERIVQGKKETMDSLRKAGRDLSGFDKAAKSDATKPPANAAGKSHEQLIQEANAAIAGGADETKVRERLKQLGVEIK